MLSGTDAALHVRSRAWLAALERAEVLGPSDERHRVAAFRQRLATLMGRTRRRPVTVRTRLFSGQPMWVAVPEIVGDELCRRGFIEAPVTRFLLNALRPGMVFYDVGAHYGYYSVLASALVGPTGRVVAFEPGRSVLGLLRRNTAALANVTVVPAAAHRSTGFVELADFGLGRAALNTVWAAARVPPLERPTAGQRYEVPALTLDGYAALSAAVPDVVKIDAEGAEVAVLQGMRNLLRDHGPAVTLETGDYEGMDSPTTAAAIDALEREGYAAYDYEGGLRPHRRRARYGYGNLVFSKGGGGAGEGGPDPERGGCAGGR